MRMAALSLLTLTVAAAIIGCSNDEPDSNMSSGFSLGRNIVDIPETGGTASVPYFIENPKEELNVQILNADDYGWIESFEISQEEITMTVLPLDLDEDGRHAEINVSYGDEQQSFQINQLREDLNPEISLEVTRTSTESVWVKIVPSDSDMLYWKNIMETDKVNDFETDEELFAEDVRWFQTIADIYYYGNIEEFYYRQFENIEYTSPHSSFSASYNLAMYYPELELKPSTDYTVYCYGMDGEGNRLTRIYKAEARTKDIVTENTVLYNIENRVEAQTVYTTVKPSDDAQLYFVNSILYEEGDSKTEAELRETAQQYIDHLIYVNFGSPSNLEMGLTVEQIVDLLFYRGEITVETEFSFSNRKGCSFVASIDENGQVVSEVYAEEFYLDSPTSSDNQISLEVYDISPWSAYYSAQPTNNEETYLVFNLKADFIEGMTDEEIMEHLASNVRWYEFAHNGSSEGELRALERNTDYVLVAFGYENAASITNLFKYEYTTKDAPVSDVKCSLNIEYFNGDEVLELYPEFGGVLARSVFVYMEAVHSGNPVTYYYSISNADSYYGFIGDGTPVYVKDLTDDQALYLLKEATSTPTAYAILDFNRPCVAYAVAQDADGNYGPIYKQEITFTKEGCSSIENFPEL